MPFQHSEPTYGIDDPMTTVFDASALTLLANTMLMMWRTWHDMRVQAQSVW